MRVSNQGSILDRASESDWSPVQRDVDACVDGFVRQATEARSLAAMTVGGLAYRFGRLGAMSLGNGSALRAVSVGLGLAAEVSIFELTHRTLSSNSKISDSKSEPPNLWRWSGPHGLRQGLLQSFITFGTLKGAGRLAQGENFLFQHLLQDSAMVFGHRFSADLNLAPPPEGSLAQQFLHAEAANLQIRAGMSLAHGLTPALSALDRGLDISLQTPSAPPLLSLKRAPQLRPAWAGAGTRQEGKRPSGLLAVKISEEPVTPLVTLKGSLPIPKNALETYRLSFEELQRDDFKDFRKFFRVMGRLEKEGPPFDFQVIVDSLWQVLGVHPSKLESPAVFSEQKRRLQGLLEKKVLKGFAILPIYNAVQFSENPRQLNALIARMNQPEVARALLKVEFYRMAAGSEGLKSTRTMRRILKELKAVGDLLKRNQVALPELASAYMNISANPHFRGKANISEVIRGLSFTVFPGVQTHLAQEIMGKLLGLRDFRMKSHRQDLLCLVRSFTDPRLRVQFLGFLASGPRVPSSEILWITREILSVAPLESAHPGSPATLEVQELASLQVAALGDVGSNPNATNLPFVIAKIRMAPVNGITRAAALARVVTNPNMEDRRDFLSILDGMMQLRNPEALKEVLKIFLSRRHLPEGMVEEVWVRLAAVSPPLVPALALYHRHLKAAN